ncbi:helix-turn-helix domain-containing protein [Streptomyces sp. ICBB 8177]|uniref:helix-turn-helix domain-containing protein n=1 Tax=Streptomyces sp. ICBB 8177 TaxID=563922 RepID=UPI000D6769D3|nr:helix-turn-helix domain-containing protein [Streptomyces sp. ICBB 8177]PWI45147.1 DNA-binding protein [Streptomyces sp. ICBB 8177]
MQGDPTAEAATVARIRRADDVLDIQRAARKGGIESVLRWLVRRTGAKIPLMTHQGTPVHQLQPPLSDAERGLALRGARELAERRRGAVAIDQDEFTCIVLPLEGSPGVSAPLLAAVAPRPVPPGLPLLLADATSALSLSWLAEHLGRQRLRLRAAEAGTREAAVHLLLNGHTSAARQVAGALGPALPAMVRVYVIEVPPQDRDRRAEELAAATDDEMWIVPCPVYADHIFVLEPGTRAPTRAWPPHLTATCWIGESNAVPLRETATGYAQAFHALASARASYERQISFAASPHLTLAIGPAVAAWAKAFLAPIHAHTPGRAQDPDATELLTTAASWISFRSGATAHLKIHRNTLSARLTYIQDLLGVNLHRLADQAALALALRATTAKFPPSPERDATGVAVTPTLTELLQLPHIRAWAQEQLRPLTAPDVPTYIEETLTTWLRLDARIGPTAAALSISASAVRKRLTHSEALLKRSLLRRPSAVHDLWLARHALGQIPLSHCVQDTIGGRGLAETQRRLDRLSATRDTE